MHRRKLLNLVARYASRHPEEASTVDRLVEFVQRHERCFHRDLWVGHVTGSAWVVDPGGSSVLLTHHRKLGIWVQLGGHSDGDPDTPAVALREATEESGLVVDFVQPDIFDIDIHAIPARKQDPEHFHYDIRFALRSEQRDFVVSEESMDLAWVPIAQLQEYTAEPSMLRMRRKWLAATA